MKKKKERDIYDQLKLSIKELAFMTFMLGLFLGLLIGELWL